MLKIVIKNLIRRLNAHNTCCITGVNDHYNEAEINLLIDLLQEFKIKVAITSLNPHTQGTVTNIVDHSSHRLVYGWGSWQYTEIHFDFAKITKDEKDPNSLTKLLLELNLEWLAAKTVTCKLD